LLDAIGERSGDLLRALGRSWKRPTTEPRAILLGRLAEDVGTRNRPDELSEACEDLASPDPAPYELPVLAGLLLGQSRAREPRLLGSNDPNGPRSESWSRIESALKRAELDWKTDATPAWLRVMTLEALVLSRSPGAGRIVSASLDPSRPPELQRAAAQAIATLTDPSIAATLLADWERQAISTRRIALQSLVATPTLAAKLLDAIEAGSVPRAEIDPAMVDSLRTMRGDPFGARLGRLFASASESNRREVVARRSSDLTRASEPTRGRPVFERHCQSCHARNGQGGTLGPDLASVAGRPATDLLTAILDPSREVPADGQGFVVETAQGQTHTGLLAEETPTTVRVRQAEGVERIIPRAEVAAIRPTGRSLRPEGFEQLLSSQELADLIAFLRAGAP
jgi:putative heme-binding domain-containing protein